MHSSIIGLLSGPLLYIAQADFPPTGFMPGNAEKYTLLGFCMLVIWVVVKAYHASNEARIAEIKATAASLEEKVSKLQEALLTDRNIDLSGTTRRSLIASNEPKSNV